MNETIKLLVLESIEEINNDLDKEEFYAPSLNTNFFELVDSLAMLDFILDIEQRLEGRFGKYIQIANENIMNASNTPFKTIKDVVEFISSIVENEVK